MVHHQMGNGVNGDILTERKYNHTTYVNVNRAADGALILSP